MHSIILDVDVEFENRTSKDSKIKRSGRDRSLDNHSHTCANGFQKRQEKLREVTLETRANLITVPGEENKGDQRKEDKDIGLAVMQ